MIRPISIALVYGGTRSHTYAKIMANLIEQKCSQLPLIPLLVDGSNKNGQIMEIIQNTFEPSDHAFIFISGVYEGRKVNESRLVKMTTPNLMIEFGYLYRKLGDKRIKLILDFPFSDIERNIFCFPTDLSGNMVCPVPNLNDASVDEIQRILSEILDGEIEKIKQENSLSDIYNISTYYMPKIDSIFAREKSEGLDDCALEKQFRVVYHNWKTELKEFTQMRNVRESIKDAYILMYLYERVLFFAAFNQVKIRGLDIGLLMPSVEVSKTIFSHPEATLFNNIIDYVLGHSKETQAEFYNERIRIFEKYEGQYDTYNLPYIIIRNYIGLCCLNYYERKSKDSSYPLTDYLERAQKCFDEVLELSREKYTGTLIYSMLRSYACFNRARVRFLLGYEKDKWATDFDDSRRERERLSEMLVFPEFIRLYYKNEMYHSINGKIYALTTQYQTEKIQMPEIMKRELSDLENKVLNELKRFEETVIAGQSFFQGVKENAQNNLTRLSNFV